MTDVSIAFQESVRQESTGPTSAIRSWTIQLTSITQYLVLFAIRELNTTPDPPILPVSLLSPLSYPTYVEAFATALDPHQFTPYPIGPILDHAEFTSRFLKAQQGDAKALGPLGELIAKVLVIWAASYGVDERGIELPPDGIEGVKMRRKKCKEMVKELLALIDAYAILRKPSWDGVRVLLLTIPLTEG
jgi:hypothetical protein